MVERLMDFYLGRWREGGHISICYVYLPYGGLLQLISADLSWKLLDLIL
jgi:hypothetical protein